MSQPFIYGRAVQRQEFLNREAELQTIFNRLHNGESTAVVGEPHLGKTSLLFQLADAAIQRYYLGKDTKHIMVSHLDLHSIGIDYTPSSFWEEALDPLRERPEYRLVAEQVTQAGYSKRALERFFNNLSKQEQRLVLLLDEFERLLIHPNFQGPAFFTLLRSLATRTSGLAFVFTSRLSVAAMNERGQRLLELGSPFFNNVIEVRLRPFDESTVNMLLDRAGKAFSSDDRRFVRRVAGRHPFLLQAMAATLVETTGDNRHARAAETFFERIASHFDDLWRTLDDQARTTAVILCLMELGGRAFGRDFSYGEIERADIFGLELRKLAMQGLAEQVGKGWEFDRQHLLLWRGERWTVGAQGFLWWVRDVIIAKSREVPTYDEWLVNKCYRFLLTQQQWDRLVGMVRNAPDWAVRGVGGLAGALFEELVKRE